MRSIDENIDDSENGANDEKRDNNNGDCLNLLGSAYTLQAKQLTPFPISMGHRLVLNKCSLSFNKTQLERS
jgi:hypothetical protein